MDPVILFFSIIVLILSVVVHEVSHGWAAYLQGDLTAKYAGRLTLNPIKHLDLWGSLIIPTISFILGGFIFGWAKPVPYNPYNVRNAKWGELWIALAGPASNIGLAIIFSVILRIVSNIIVLPQGAVDAFALVIFINVTLAVFNLIPVPPLDGSKILSAFLPIRLRQQYRAYENYGFLLVVLFLFLFGQIIFVVSSFIFSLFTGFSI